MKINRKELFVIIKKIINKRPNKFDAVVAVIFTALILWDPYILSKEMVSFEWGLYLPGIESVLDGLIPYRDFFYLRGPFELYIPAFFMWLFGKQLYVLILYFYFGNVINMIIGVLFARVLYRTRLIMYLMMFAFIGRTYPRVYIAYWGGIRYATGLLALILFAVYCKKRKKGFLFASGIASACGIFVSIEIGISAIFSVLTALFLNWVISTEARSKIFREMVLFVVGILCVVISYFFYLHFNGALFSYFEATYSVVMNMTKVFNDYLLVSRPSNIIEGIIAMCPGHNHFRYMTPVYFYLFVGGYLIFKARKKQTKSEDVAILSLMVYGLMLYFSAFRKIQNAQYEMALQPQVILFFLFIEKAYFKLRDVRIKIAGSFGRSRITGEKVPLSKYFKIAGIYLLFTVMVMAPTNYALRRFDRRFVFYKILKRKLQNKSLDDVDPTLKTPSSTINVERLKYLMFPKDDAQEMEALVEIIQRISNENEKVLMYPEKGMQSFISGRRYFGRFPMGTFSWFNDKWHEEYIEEILNEAPRFAVTPKKYDTVYFHNKTNLKKYNDVMDIIKNNYSVIHQTERYYIYERK